MKIFKSLYFWLTLLFIALSICLFFFHALLGMKNDTIGMLAALLFGCVSLGILFIIRSFSLMRALSKKKGDSKAKKGSESWVGGVHSDISKEVEYVLNKVKKGHEQLIGGVEKRKFVLLLASSEEDLALFGESPETPWQFVHSPDGKKKAKFFWWVNQSEVYIGVKPEYLSKTEANQNLSLKSLLHFLEVNGKERCLDCLVPLVNNDLLKEKANWASMKYSIQHSMEILHLNLPVSILVTDLQKLERFASIKEALFEKSQKALGFALPYSNEQNFSELVQKNCDAWTAQFQKNKTVLSLKLWQKQAPSEDIFYFLENWVSHCKTLASFTEFLFQQKLQQEKSFLRGVFWCGVVDGGAPAEVPLDQIDFSLETEAPTESKSVPFLLEEFKAWMGSQKSIVRFSTHRQSSMSRSSALASLAFLFVSAGLVCVSLFSFTAGKILASDWKNTLVPSQNLDFSQVKQILNSHRQLDTLHNLQESLEHDRPWSIAPGFYLSKNIKLESKTRYNALLSQWMGMGLASLEEELKELSYQSDIFDKSRLYNKLKLYLLLTHMGKDHLGGKDKKFVESQLSTLALEVIGKSASDLNQDDKKYMPIHLQNYIVLLEEKESYRSDEPMVKRLREILLDESNIEGQYQRILNKAVDFPDLTLIDLGFPENSLIRSDVAIPGAFTFAAYDSLLRESLESTPTQSNDWILGQNTSSKVKSLKEKEKLQAAVRERYYEEYLKHWTGLTQNLVLEMPNEFQEISTQFSLLASADQEGSARGLRSFIRTVWQNVNLKEKQADEKTNNELKEKAFAGVKNRNLIEGQLDKVSAKRFKSLDVPRKKIRDAFASLRYLNEEIEKGVFDVYFSDLENLARFVVQAGGEDDATLTFVQAVFKDDRLNPLVHAWNDVEERFKKITIRDKKWLERMWLNPLKSVVRKLNASAAKSIDRKFKEEVYGYYKSYFHGSYPFSSSLTAREVSISELTTFFNRNDGLFTKFLKDIAPFVSFDKGYGQKERWKSLTLPFSRKALKQLEVGVKLRNSLFGENANKITPFQLDFEIEDSRRADVNLTVGEERAEMVRNNGSVSLRSKWPEENHSGIQLQISTLRSQFDKGEAGEWGLLKFLPRASEVLNNNSLKAEWRIQDTSYYISVGIKVRIDKVRNPFTSKNFFKFECPQSLFEYE